MWTRIYVGVLAAAVLAVGFFTYYSLGWLQSIGRPADAIAGYEYTSGISWTMLCFCSVILLFIACGVMWSSGKAWALYLTLAYFAFFVAVQGFWMDREYQQLLERTAGIDTRVWATPVISLLLIVGAAVPVLALQYLVLVIRRKFQMRNEDPMPLGGDDLPLM